MTLILPLDWIFELKEANTAVMTATNKMDEIKYPCDNEEEQEDGSDDDNMGSTSVMTKRSSEKYLLEVNSLSQIYADGTQAVKDMSFRVKEGEVLSFLGSNGAGKLL
jgi:ABC-type glutathione transport system ATPase component